MLKRNNVKRGQNEPEEEEGFALELKRIHVENQERDASFFWDRPPVPQELLRSSCPLIFQQIELDETKGFPRTEFVRNEIPGVKSAPVIRMFGVTKSQNSVLCHVHGFWSYFFIRAPTQFLQSDIEAFKSALNSKLTDSISSASSEETVIVDVEIVQKEDIYHFNGNRKVAFLKITTALPSHVPAAKRILELGMSFGRFEGQPVDTYESNIPYILRFMIDLKMPGMSWIEIPESMYSVRKQKNTPCQLEVDVHYSDLICHAAEGIWQDIAPLRILSFDIECAGRKGVFPEPSHDPIIQIANMVTVQGEKTPFIRNVFTLKKCANIVGSQVLSFETEHEMLEAWSKFFVQIDPDVITGYNINNFDWDYLLERAKTLNVHSFPFLGRISDSQTRAKDTVFSSKAYGTRESKTLTMEGRVIFDMLQVIQRDYKLRSYTLNAVSSHFLGEQKEDVQHSIITDLQNGNEETRRRLAIYCLKDAYLPQRLMDKLMSLINYIEMSRVTGVPFNYLLARGQQIKVVSQLFRKAIEHDFVVPAMKSEVADEQYEGATVIEPIKGYYDVPIATLDFASLYPSIMMAHNLCYSTLLVPSTITRYNLNPDDYIKTPSGDYFVKSHVRKGLLPIILEDLISARKKAKADLKKETDPFKKAVLDGRQLALKISANSVYGFTGATVGKLPCIPISQSTTSFGRQMIEQTKDLVEAKFCRGNGYAEDAKVIYGDTDSVMVRFGVPDLETSMTLGREAAEYVSATFIKPIKLEFEKVYFPYLLISKKRYAGLYWTNPNKYDKMDTKGIETVRRDNCRLVQNVIDSCLRKILIERDVVGAQEYAKQVISDLLQNKIDLSQLVITKALSRSGEDYAGKQAHVELAERMKKRDAGSAPTLGDRVAYVIIQGGKGAAAYEKSEDPLYVLDHNLPIDTKYYLNNQLANPLTRIFEPIMKNPKELLSGDHTRVIQVATSTAGILAKFAVKKAQCLGCRVALKDQTQPVCEYCRPKITEIYQKQITNTNELEVKFQRLWTQCQRCQGSLHQDVLCSAKDCPIFYMRKRAAKDLQEATKTIQRFDYAW